MSLMAYGDTSIGLQICLASAVYAIYCVLSVKVKAEEEESYSSRPRNLGTALREASPTQMSVRSHMHPLPNFSRAEYQSGASQRYTKWRSIDQSDNRYQMIRPFVRHSSHKLAYICHSALNTFS